MNVVFDTGVLIAAFTTRGLCSTLFEITLNRHRLFVSSYLFKEMIMAFQAEVGLPRKLIRDTLRYMRDVCSIVEPDPLPKRACSHRLDDRILALAKHVRADCLVTADIDLLALKAYHAVKIVNPRQFWEMNKPHRPPKKKGKSQGRRHRSKKGEGGEHTWRPETAAARAKPPKQKKQLKKRQKRRNK